MLVVGLTGGIATGKSTVAGYFRAAGAQVVDADQMARQVVQPGKPAWSDIVKHFGRAVLNADGTLDRKRLGDIVFEDSAQRKLLEDLIHPWVRREMDAATAQIAAAAPEAVIVQDVPLLLETGRHRELAEIIVVYVPETIQLRRLVQRDGMDEAKALVRIRSQMPIEKKKQLATIIIDNSGSLQQTRKQTVQVFEGLSARAGSPVF